MQSGIMAHGARHYALRRHVVALVGGGSPRLLQRKVLVDFARCLLADCTVADKAGVDAGLFPPRWAAQRIYLNVKDDCLFFHCSKSEHESANKTHTFEYLFQEEKRLKHKYIRGASSNIDVYV